MVKKLFERYKGIISYLFFGICTTIVNIISYYICAHWFRFSTVESTVVAWGLAVIFAYVTNKLFVFESCSWKWDIVAREVVSFLACRTVTGLLDILIMYIGVDKWGLYDVGVKIFSNVGVIVLNYMASKWVIFKRENLME